MNFNEKLKQTSSYSWLTYLFDNTYANAVEFVNQIKISVVQWRDLVNQQ